MSDKNPVLQEGKRERSGEADLFSRFRARERARSRSAGALEEMSDGAVVQSCAPSPWP